MNLVKEFKTKDTLSDPPNRPLEVIRSQKWVRVSFGGEIIVDSKNVLLLRQKGRSPVYYFPRKDVRLEFLEEKGRIAKFPGLGKTSLLTVRVGDRVAENAAWLIVEPSPEALEIEGYIAFKWAEMEAWYEENEEVFVHPRDPYVRIDAIQSSRRVRVELDGEIIAETDHPVLLFETGLPARFYIPREDIRLDLLEPSDTHTACPYKGVASYYSINMGDRRIKDVAWYYPNPYAEVGKIQNLVAFYLGKVDAIYVDGIKQA
jgi:uncharacterized protein (DUF427 family)